MRPMVPTWVAVPQSLTTKSADRHFRTAPGLPNTPSGRFTTTSLATSGWFGSARRIAAVRSGWPPACEWLELTENSSIGGLAAAGAASTAARATLAKRAPIACLLILIVSLLIVFSAVPAGRRGALAVVLLVVALHALAVAADEVLTAGLHGADRKGARLARDLRVDVRWRWGLGSGPVALIRRRAGERRSVVRETTARPGVIDLDCAAVFVFTSKCLAGEEEGVLFTWRHGHELGVFLARASGDQLDGAVVPLVCVLFFIRVPQHQGLSAVEEDATVFGEAQAIGGQMRVARGGRGR